MTQVLPQRILQRIRSSGNRILGYHSWNWAEDQLRLVNDPRVILDIGANLGQAATRYRAMYPYAEIFSFEPVPDSVKALRSRFAADEHFQAHQLAVSDNCSDVEMYLQFECQCNSLLKPAEARKHKDTMTVRSITVDQFCHDNGIQRIDILKIDAEGSERAVLIGAEEMFGKRAIRSVFIEVYFEPVYSGMALFTDLDTVLRNKGFGLYGLYSLTPARQGDGHLQFANALYRMA